MERLKMKKLLAFFFIYSSIWASQTNTRENQKALECQPWSHLFTHPIDTRFKAFYCPRGIKTESADESKQLYEKIQEKYQNLSPVERVKQLMMHYTPNRNVSYECKGSFSSAGITLNTELPVFPYIAALENEKHLFSDYNNFKILYSDTSRHSQYQALKKIYNIFGVFTYASFFIGMVSPYAFLGGLAGITGSLYMKNKNIQPVMSTYVVPIVNYLTIYIDDSIGITCSGDSNLQINFTEYQPQIDDFLKQYSENKEVKEAENRELYNNCQI